MSLSRRKFLATVAKGGAVLTSPGVLAAPYQVSVERDSRGAKSEGLQRIASSGHAGTVPVIIPSTMPMGPGAPLGGLGTGFVEIRADGCFYEWQIFNAGPWGQNVRSTTAPSDSGPQYLRFLLHDLRFLLHARRASAEVPEVRRLYLRSDETNDYVLPFLQDVESIDYYGWFPMTGLRYNDPTLPVRVSAQVFHRSFPATRTIRGLQDFMLFTP